MDNNHLSPELNSADADRLTPKKFPDVLEVECKEIEQRRRRLAAQRRQMGGKTAAKRYESNWRVTPLLPQEEGVSSSWSPTPARTTPGSKFNKAGLGEAGEDRRTSRRIPVPKNLNGLCLSGGGIRSAAVCLGALQALNANRAIDCMDYLSTVSGGGYIGASLTVAASPPDGRQTKDDDGSKRRDRPSDTSEARIELAFGKDVQDSAFVAHLRNYSNYLLPRGRSSLQNYSEAAAILVRGPLVNLLLVLLFLLPAAAITAWTYPSVADLRRDGFVTSILAPWVGWLDFLIQPGVFRPTKIVAGVLGLALVAWVGWRSWVIYAARNRTGSEKSGLFASLGHGSTRAAGDADSRSLTVARILIYVLTISAILDIQPLALCWLDSTLAKSENSAFDFKYVMALLATTSGSIAAFGDVIGRFLRTTEQSIGLQTLVLRAVSKAVIVIGALILPLLLWLCYLQLTLWAMDFTSVPRPSVFGNVSLLLPYIGVALVLVVFSLLVAPNSYSLHRFYRDRLSRAFIVDPVIASDGQQFWRDSLKLSEIRAAGGPYHLINAAMNVQGSSEANRRGRGADFFIFSRNFIGSELTDYVHTSGAQSSRNGCIGMETLEPQIDLATAMAISGAAVSANMGVSTMRLLSPTLALLNVRLGYWLRNPKAIANGKTNKLDLKNIWRRNFSLGLEMFNNLDERSPYVFLTDGGHIENLGAYELLKRGCQLVFVVDAEADSAMAFPSLLRLERYARIDLGVRIILPWEEISQAMLHVDKKMSASRGTVLSRDTGPHCAVGRIFYPNGSKGVMVYFKSSLSGDEKDYILDYKRRNPAFPHETTGDQFFSEEQFECYRALGFHMVDGFLKGDHKFQPLETALGGWATPEEAMREVKLKLTSAVGP